MVSFGTVVKIVVALSASCTTSVAFLQPNMAASRTSTNHKIRVTAEAMRTPTQRQHCYNCWSTQLSASNVADAELTTEQKSPLPTPPEHEDAETASEELEFSVQQQVINAVFLAATFGYAIFTILNIDSGMTRGWTGSEIAMRIPLDNWGAYESYLANQPIMTKTFINVIIYLLGDWLSQTAFQGKNVLHFNISRTLKNGFIGLCFGPLVHQYYQFSDHILPPEDGLVTRLEKILMDQTVYLTVKCAIYISAVGLLSGDDWDTVKETVKEKIGGIVVTAWKFWPLVHCVTYGFIPARHRVLWVNSVDLVWNAILATMSQKDSPQEEDVALAPVVLEDDDVLDVKLVNSTGELNPLLVLDNQWVEDAKGDVVDMLLPKTTNRSTNTTLTDAALGTA